MNKNRIYKGQLGYVRYERKWELFKTILLFALPIAIFIMGMVTTGTKKNLLSIVAVLGLLPASKSLVAVIMYCRCEMCPPDAVTQIAPIMEAFPEGTRNGVYELNITTKERNYPIAHLMVISHTVIGLSLHKDQKEKKKHPYEVRLVENYLKECLPNNGYKDYTVKIFTDCKPYCERLNTLREKGEVSELDESALNFLLGLSL